MTDSEKTIIFSGDLDHDGEMRDDIKALAASVRATPLAAPVQFRGQWWIVTSITVRPLRRLDQDPHWGQQILVLGHPATPPA